MNRLQFGLRCICITDFLSVGFSLFLGVLRTLLFDRRGVKQILSLLILCFVGFVLSLILLLLSFSFYSSPSLPITSLERGFWFFTGTRSKFSLDFFLLSVIFVVFDLELVLFLPLLPMGLISSVSVLFLWLFIWGSLVLEAWWGKLSWFYFF